MGPVLFRVDPAAEARATAEERGLQCPQLVSAVPVRCVLKRVQTDARQGKWGAGGGSELGSESPELLRMFVELRCLRPRGRGCGRGLRTTQRERPREEAPPSVFPGAPT